MRVKRSTGRAARHLFSSILKCKVCGSNYVLADKWFYACSGYVNGKTWEREQLRAVREETPVLRVLRIAKPLDREVLLDLIDRPKTARLRHAAKVTEWISKLEYFGFPEFKDNALRYRNAVCAPVAARPDGLVDDLNHWILPMAGWALAILLDRGRKVGQYLHQCRHARRPNTGSSAKTARAEKHASD